MMSPWLGNPRDSSALSSPTNYLSTCALPLIEQPKESIAVAAILPKDQHPCREREGESTALGCNTHFQLSAPFRKSPVVSLSLSDSTA